MKTFNLWTFLVAGLAFVILTKLAMIYSIPFVAACALAAVVTVFTLKFITKTKGFKNTEHDLVDFSLQSIGAAIAAGIVIALIFFR